MWQDFLTINRNTILPVYWLSNQFQINYIAHGAGAVLAHLQRAKPSRSVPLRQFESLDVKCFDQMGNGR